MLILGKNRDFRVCPAALTTAETEKRENSSLSLSTSFILIFSRHRLYSKLSPDPPNFINNFEKTDTLKNQLYNLYSFFGFEKRCADVWNIQKLFSAGKVILWNLALMRSEVPFLPFCVYAILPPPFPFSWPQALSSSSSFRLQYKPERKERERKRGKKLPKLPKWRCS